MESGCSRCIFGWKLCWKFDYCWPLLGKWCVSAISFSPSCPSSLYTLVSYSLQFNHVTNLMLEYNGLGNYNIACAIGYSTCMIPCIHTDVYCMNSQYIALPKEKRRNINGELITLQSFEVASPLYSHSHLRSLFIFYFSTTTRS